MGCESQAAQINALSLALRSPLQTQPPGCAMRHGMPIVLNLAKIAGIVWALAA